MRVAASCFWVFAFGFGPPLLSPGGVSLCCCPCLAMWPAALWFVVVCLGALLPSVASCGAVLACSAVRWSSFPSPSLKTPCKSCKNVFTVLKINYDYILRNTRASSKTTNLFLSCMLHVGLHGIVV